MSSRSLPLRPSLAQLKRQAKELLQKHSQGKPSAAARISAQHPRLRSASLDEVLAAPFALADAQLVIAREYGYQNWAALKHDVEATNRVAKFEPHPRFDDAVHAIDAGDLGHLHHLLGIHPELVHARTNLEPPFGYFTGATLLHHVAWNPGRAAPMPSNTVEVARLLLDHGAVVDAITLGRSAGTTMGLIITSKMASDANFSGPLMDLLLERGARLDLRSSAAVIPDWGEQSVLDVPLSNHAPRAAEKLIELGARPDVCAAAALGRMDLVRSFFDEDGRLHTLRRRHGTLLSEPDAIGLALLFAYVNKQHAVVEYLLEKNGNWNMTGVNNGTVLHRAAWEGDLAMVQRLVARDADISNRDNPFTATPLSWAQHNKQIQVFDWLRTHCRIDLHDAVGFDLREHVEARLEEEPASVNKRIDQWDAPQSTPLYWAAWTRVQDVDGEHLWSEASRAELVALLLDRGADPNIVAGDGHTALDVAHAVQAPAIAALISQHGGKRAADL